MSYNDQGNDTSSSEINKTLEDRKDFVFLSFLFLFTSSLTSYIYVCLIDIFFQQGLLPFELEPLNLLLIPQYLKVLFCPFIDTFYIRKLGRRKTFIVLILGILTFYSLILSFIYPKFILNEDVKIVRDLALFELVLVLLLEICAESWIIDYVYDDNYKFAAGIKYIASYIGAIFTIYFQASSKIYFFLISIYSIVLLIYTYIYKMESDRYYSKMKLKSLYKRIGKLCTDLFEKECQIKLLFIIISNFGLGFAEIILEQQLKLDQIYNFQNFKLNLQLILTVSLSLGISILLLMKFKVLPIYLIAQIIRNINNIFIVVINNYFPQILQNIIPIYKNLGESCKAIQAILIYIVTYNSTKQKLSATMMVIFLLAFKLGQDGNKLFSQYCYNSFGSPGDTVIGLVIQSFILIFAFEQREAIFYKQ